MKNPTIEHPKILRDQLVVKRNTKLATLSHSLPVERPTGLGERCRGAVFLEDVVGGSRKGWVFEFGVIFGKGWLLEGGRWGCSVWMGWRRRGESSRWVGEGERGRRRRWWYYGIVGISMDGLGGEEEE